MRFPVMASVTITDQAGRTLVGPDDRGILELDFPHGSVGRGDQLCVGSRADATLSGGAFADRSDLRQLPSQCRPAQRIWRLRPVATQHGSDAAASSSNNGWLNIVGGCCGTTPRYIEEIAQIVEGVAATSCCRRWSDSRGSAARRRLTFRPDTNFVMIGERNNVTGSRKFARLIREEKFDEAIEISRQQVAAGASIIDINMDDALLDGEAMMTRFLNLIAAEPDISRVPVMIDSSRWSVLEAGLKCMQGKSIVNSISLKDGEEEFLRRARLIRRYGAAAVVMAFDETGQATEVDDKVRICRRAYRPADRASRVPARGHYL